MKTRNALLATVRKISVNCKENSDFEFEQRFFSSPVRYLGYDFSVDADSVDEMKNFIRTLLAKYKQPFINFNVGEEDEIEFTKVWTREQIEECIKKGYGE